MLIRSFHSYRAAFSCISLLGLLLWISAPFEVSAASSDAQQMPFGSDYSFLLESRVPEVLSTTHLRQPKSKMPGSTTIVQGQLIRDLGIRTLVEVFRLVPGMTVAYVQSNKPVTSYHGTVAEEQRRLQVLIDGRTAYQPGLARVDWNAMPVALESIERIEVSRGPNAAAYGINAFLGTINIITRSPEDTAGVSLHSSLGSRGYREAFGAVSSNASDDYNWRLAYQKRMSDGFDARQQKQPDGSFVHRPFHNGYNFNLVTYDSSRTLNERQSVDFRAGITDGVDEVEKAKIGDAFGAREQPDVSVNDRYLQLRWNYEASANHFFHIQSSYQGYNRQQRWRTCPVGFEPLCATTNQNTQESRLEFEIQDTLRLSPQLRLVSGLGYRKDTISSDTYFNGDEGSYQSRVYTNIEYTPVSWLTFNLGGNNESTTNLDKDFFSPRVAANFQLTDNQTLRFVFSKAVRIPSTFEQYADWGYRAINVTPVNPYGFLEGQRVGPTFQSPGTFREERIISREISYFNQLRYGNALWSTEVKFFHDNLRDIISGRLDVSRWDLENNVALNQQGFEVESSLAYQRSRFRLTYAYMDQDGDYRGVPKADYAAEQRYVQFESRLTVQHSGSLAWIQRYPNDIKTATAYYFADSFKEGPFRRGDFRLVKSVHTPRLSYDVAFVMQHYFNDKPPHSRDNIIKDRNQYFIEAGVRF